MPVQRGFKAKFCFLLAFCAARLAALGCRLFGYPGTSLPGVVALKFYPRLVEFLAPSYERVMAVTGTNGKTTTANLLAHFLRSSGFTVAHNAEGANMLPGAAAALIRDCDRRGRPRSRVALLEVDEGSVGRVFPAAKPGIVVVTNYFRDQLDRYWELERTTGLLRSTLAGLPGVTLVLNADDPLVAAVGRDRANARYYGVNRENGQNSGTEECAKSSTADSVKGSGPGVSGETREGRYCASCGTELVYRYFHYGQLGDYFCPGCGFRRPDPDLAAFCVEEGERLDFTVRVGSQTLEKASVSPAHANGATGGAGSRPAGAALHFTAPLRGFYNVYNILAAAAAASALGVPLDAVRRSLLDYRPATGRMEEFTLGGRTCTLALIKNPAGVNEVLKTILATGTAKSLVLAINDLAADGRDVSWLWDADFARLADGQVKRIVCAGLRAADMMVCLKYAGVSPERLVLAPDRAESLRVLAEQEGEELFVLATYTNLFDYARLLQRAGKGKSKSASQNLPSLS